ncbi:MAG TPA: hypothetical protein VKR21_07390 [Solirubrobacteraceae bacterium]|nr:hypothetical protein [Solirubrobacteraceae bacterium]
MSELNEGHLPQDLEAVAGRLRAQRIQPDPLQLDQVKQRVMARSAPDRGRLAFMRSRIASLLTVAALLGGTGGAIAVANQGGTPNHGAASGEYKPGKGCGDKNHEHQGPPGNPGNNKCPSK